MDTTAGLGPPVRVVDLPVSVRANSGWISINASGNLYISNPDAILLKRSAVSTCDGGSALPRCMRGHEIEILTSTTRWRPQKDVTRDASGNPVKPDPLNPVVIKFTAPKGFTPTGLEITDPSGALLGGQQIDISGPTDPNADPGQYMITWRGPWSWKDSMGQVKYHSTGNYTFKIRGTKADGTALESDPTKPCADAAAGTPSCSVVSLVEVTAVTMMDKPRTRGRVPNRDLGGPGGGWAIFPEATKPSPNDQVGDEDKVEIIATVIPPVPDPRSQGPVTVYFRSIDVDDPSAGIDPITGASSPVDDERLPQDNCRGVVCAVPKAGNLNGQDGDTPVPVPLPSKQSRVAADFQVSGRQGDNYRVSASTSATWLQGLGAKQNSAFGEVIHSSREPVLDSGGAKGPQVSEMLTVWRTLHLEEKRMDPVAAGVTQDKLQHNGTWTDIKKSDLVDKPDHIKDATHPDKNDWQGAYLRPIVPDLNVTEFEPGIADATTVFYVKKSDKKSVTVDSGDMRSFDSSPDKSYFIRDDELTSLTRRQHDILLLESLLTRAYMVVDTVTNPAPVISWTSPLTPDALNGITRLANSDAYWSVPLVLAFECNIPGNSTFENEHDNHKPDDIVVSSGILGLTCGGGVHCQDAADGPIAATFTETTRDFGWTDRSSIKPTVPVDEIYGSDGAHEGGCPDRC